MQAMLATVSSRQISAWFAFNRYRTEERIGPQADQDRRTAVIAHTVYATAGAKPARKFEDFLPQLKQSAEQTPGDLRSRMIALAKRSRGRKQADPVGNTEQSGSDAGAESQAVQQGAGE